MQGTEDSEKSQSFSWHCQRSWMYCKALEFLKHYRASLSQGSSDPTTVSSPQGSAAFTFPLVFLHSVRRHCLLFVSLPTVHFLQQ